MPPNAENSEEPLPVLFWIFGGGYIAGDGWEFTMYQGQKLAKATNCIVVAANYRVAAFGFLAAENLSGGNMGIQVRGCEERSDVTKLLPTQLISNI